MTLSSKPAVLIVGAGPTGLMMACQLALRGIPFRIIDQKPGPSDASKALVLQARSLEIFDQMGLAPQVLHQGHQARGLNFLLQGRWVQHISLPGLGQKMSSYPFLCILEQSKTEGLLLDFLAQYHLQVEWNTELIHVEQNPDQVKVRLRYKDLRQQQATFSWVTGTDGAASKVREACQIPLAGSSAAHTFVVADTQVNWDYSHQEVLLCQGKNKLAVFIPMPGEKRFRVLSLLPGHLLSQARQGFGPIAADLERNLGFPLSFHDTTWYATYQLQHRYARQFRQGRCFLAGDAAHTHSPAGGQGLNTGLQDAYNLAWKLALVIRHQAAPELLDTYQQERLPAARKLVVATDRIFGFLVTANPLLRGLRQHLLLFLLKKIFRYQHLQTRLFRQVSQLSLHYRKSPLSVSARDNNHFPRQAPRPGDRVPFAQVFSPDHAKLLPLYELLRQPYFTLLVFKSTFSTDRAEQLLATLQEELPAPLQQLVVPILVYPHEKNNAVYELFGINEDAFYLVRPDNYLAFRSQPASVDSLVEYLLDALQVPQTSPDEPNKQEDLFDPAFD